MRYLREIFKSSHLHISQDRRSNHPVNLTGLKSKRLVFDSHRGRITSEGTISRTYLRVADCGRGVFMCRFSTVLWTQSRDLEHVYDFSLKNSLLRASRSSLHLRIVLDKEICSSALDPAGCEVATVASGVAAPASMELREVSEQKMFISLTGHQVE